VQRPRRRRCRQCVFSWRFFRAGIHLASPMDRGCPNAVSRTRVRAAETIDGGQDRVCGLAYAWKFRTDLRRKEAVMSIAYCLQDYIAGRQFFWDPVEHRPSGSCIEAARLAHVPPDRVAKAVVLRGHAGYLMAVIRPTTSGETSAPRRSRWSAAHVERAGCHRSGSPAGLQRQHPVGRGSRQR
jgi:hypothetical protein